MAELTKEEMRVLELSRDLWNAFHALPILNEADQHDIAHHVRAIQNCLLSRSVVAPITQKDGETSNG